MFVKTWGDFSTSDNFEELTKIPTNLNFNQSESKNETYISLYSDW